MLSDQTHLLVYAHALTGAGSAWHTCSADPETMIMGHRLTEAWDSPAIPCTAPGPDTVSSTPGTPVRKPQAAAAYPAACSFLNPMKRMPAACSHVEAQSQMSGSTTLQPQGPKAGQAQLPAQSQAHVCCLQPRGCTMFVSRMHMLQVW